MSSIIDPIITANKNRKIAVVSLTFGSGVQYASGTANGLEQVQQALAWSLSGLGTTAANGVKNVFVGPAATIATGVVNGVGVSLAAANGAATLTVLVEVQGY